MAMFPPDVWLELQRDRLRELGRRYRHDGTLPRRPSPAADVRARLAAAVRVLLARSETVAEVHHLVVAGTHRDQERDCA